MDTIALTMREQQRVTVIERVFRRELTMAEAAMVLGISERQSFRLKARIRKEGVRGVIHGNRGRSSPRKLPPTTHRRIVELARGKYRGFNDHHLTEKLADAEGITVSRETVRQILRHEGIASPRKRRPPRHRGRRARRLAEGLLLQVDGSPHDWLEGRGPALTLVGAIDDATAKVPGACFVEQETTGAYLQLFLHVFTKKGLPQAIYADRHSIFWTDREPTLEEQLAGRRPRTQVGRALDELGITLIHAGSPQAKGRVERLWGTFQDRLVSELRLAGATTRLEAQAVLACFLPQYNRRFAKAAAEATPAWRGVERTRLAHSLCFKYRRVVAKDNTVAFQGAVLPLPKRSPFVSWAHKTVAVHVLLDGSVEIFLQNDRLARCDAKTARTVGLYRANGRREVSSYGPDTTTAAQLYAMAP
ncbi:MAG: ISNCY family transposase [Candidatus Methylomirabilis sp.]